MLFSGQFVTAVALTTGNRIMDVFRLTDIVMAGRSNTRRMHITGYEQ